MGEGETTVIQHWPVDTTLHHLLSKIEIEPKPLHFIPPCPTLGSTNGMKNIVSFPAEESVGLMRESINQSFKLILKTVQ